MSQLQLDYIPVEDLASWTEALEGRGGHRQVLGMALFGRPDAAEQAEFQQVSKRDWPRLALPVLGHATSAWAEVWSVPKNAAPIEHGELDGVGYVRCQDLVFAWVNTPLPGPDAALAPLTRATYDALFKTLNQLGCAHPWRFWNYLPDILGTLQGEERYRIFNVGRHESFLRHSSMIDPHPPAACALGQPAGFEGPLTVYALASTAPAHPIENPRQISAYRYPPQYGVRSPTFSRATVAQIDTEATVFISGTASIVGHETVHLNDVSAQTEETLNNIEALLQQFKVERPGLAWTAADLKFKVYVRHAEDLPLVRAVVERRLGTQASCCYLHAVVCRPDLLVEIEASATRSQAA